MSNKPTKQSEKRIKANVGLNIGREHTLMVCCSPSSRIISVIYSGVKLKRDKEMKFLYTLKKSQTSHHKGEKIIN